MTDFIFPPFASPSLTCFVGSHCTHYTHMSNQGTQTNNSKACKSVTTLCITSARFLSAQVCECVGRCQSEYYINIFLPRHSNATRTEGVVQSLGSSNALMLNSFTNLTMRERVSLIAHYVFWRLFALSIVRILENGAGWGAGQGAWDVWYATTNK